MQTCSARIAHCHSPAPSGSMAANYNPHNAQGGAIVHFAQPRAVQTVLLALGLILQATIWCCISQFSAPILSGSAERGLSRIPHGHRTVRLLSHAFHHRVCGACRAAARHGGEHSR